MKFCADNFNLYWPTGCSSPLCYKYLKKKTLYLLIYFSLISNYEGILQIIWKEKFSHTGWLWVNASIYKCSVKLILTRSWLLGHSCKIRRSPSPPHCPKWFDDSHSICVWWVSVIKYDWIWPQTTPMCMFFFPPFLCVGAAAPTLRAALIFNRSGTWGRREQAFSSSSNKCICN